MNVIFGCCYERRLKEIQVNPRNHNVLDFGVVDWRVGEWWVWIFDGF